MTPKRVYAITLCTEEELFTVWSVYPTLFTHTGACVSLSSVFLLMTVCVAVFPRVFWELCYFSYKNYSSQYMSSSLLPLHKRQESVVGDSAQ